LLGTTVLALTGSALAQTADEFNPGADTTVYALAVQPDGKILAGRDSGTFIPPASNLDCLARYYPDGTADPGFNPLVNGRVSAVAVQPDGKILVGGEFASIGGQERQCIGRLNANGTLDTSFNPGAGGLARSSVRCFALQADGKILVAGAFTILAGGLIHDVGRLNPDGSLDPSLFAVPNGDVYALALQPDGKILVGGLFTSLCGEARNHLGRLNADGSLDTAFNPGADNTVTCLAVQADGKILVGGGFSMLAGQPRWGIGRLSPDGTLDDTFKPGVNSGQVSPMVSSLTLQADGQTVVSGAFTMLGGGTCHYLGRLNADGSLDKTFNAGADAAVWCTALQPDGKVLVGGQFSTLGGEPRKYLGRLSNTEPALEKILPDGSDIVWTRSGAAPEVWRTSLEASTNGSDWINLGAGTRTADGWRWAGPLPLNGGTPATAGATLRARGAVTSGEGNGSTWLVETSVGPPAISLQPLSRTNNAGTIASFTVVGAGVGTVNYEWYKNGQALSVGANVSGVNAATLLVSNVFAPDAGSYSVTVSNDLGSVTSRPAVLNVVDPFIAKQPAGGLVHAGQRVALTVTAIGTAPLSYQWRKDGANLLGATAASLTLTNFQWNDQGSYDVLVKNPVGSAQSTAAKLTVNLAAADSFNPGANWQVQSFGDQADGKILVGGRFTNLAGQVHCYIGRLNADGTADAGFRAGANIGLYSSILALAIQEDGKIVVGGIFTNLNGQSRSNIGRFNPDGTLDRSFVPEANDWVNCLALQPDGKILVGGYFSEFGGLPRTGLARVNPDGTLDGSFDPVLVNISRPAVWSLAVQPDGKILVAGLFITLDGQGHFCLGRLNPDGTVDATFNASDGLEASCLALEPDGKILVGGNFTGPAGAPPDNVGRLNTDGSLDPSFNPSADWTVFSMVLQADGRIVAGGAFRSLAGQSRTFIGRLNPDGSLDESFNPAADGIVEGLAIQRDGRLLAGGDFGWMGGELRSRIARLKATEPAIDDLAFDGSTIEWRRQRTSPELEWVKFQASTNGVDWLDLGAGSRDSEGWQLTGLSLPMNSTICARGYVAGGENNGSGWIVNTIIGAPTITFQPLNQTDKAGTTVSLNLLAGGTEPLSYQWFKDGLALAQISGISGTHSPALTLTNVLGSAAGAYWVVVSNDFGSVTSSIARLTVEDPCILSAPANVLTNSGRTVGFSVTAAGTGPLHYQWQRNGALISGVTSASLRLAGVQPADAGSYEVWVTNALGSVTSSKAELSLLLTTDSSFQVSPVGTVYAMATQPDGRILLGGAFSMLGGATRMSIGRIDADGTLDASFNPGVSGTVRALTLQPDGGILVGGDLWSLGGAPRSYLVRLEPDGTVDPDFNPAANGSVNCLVVQADGKILLGGDFTRLADQTRNHVARLGPDGALDAGFNPDINGTVNTVAVEPSGGILLGGNFASVGGQARTNIARVTQNGTLDLQFNPAADRSVCCLSIQPDGKIVVGGDFTHLGDVPRNYIGRLNPDGTVDESFDPVVYSSVYALALQADGKILIGSSFKQGWQIRCGIARLNSDGSLDTVFVIGGDSTVYGLAIQADGSILASSMGGFFRLLNTALATQTLQTDGSIISWKRAGTAPEVWRTTLESSPDGSSWVPLGSGSRIPGGWACLAANLSPKAYIRARGFSAGAYCNGSGSMIQSIAGPPIIVAQPIGRTNNAEVPARFNVQAEGTAPMEYQWFKGRVALADGTNILGAQTSGLQISDTLGGDAGAYWVVVSNTLGAVTSVVANLTVVDPFIAIPPYSMVGQAGGTANLQVSAIGTEPLSFLWRKDGANLATATQASLVLTNLQWADRGNYDVVVSNLFSCITSRVAILSVNLAGAEAFNPGADGQVLSLAMQPDGKVLVGGNISAISGQSVTNIGRVQSDGTLDSSFRAGANGTVVAMAVQPDGQIVVGGSFTSLCGASRPYIGRLTSQGGLDPSFNPAADNAVNFLVTEPDGTILVAGAFTALAGQPRAHLGRLNETGSLDADFDPTADDAVRALALQPDGKIVVGGRFKTLCGQPRDGIGRLNPDGSLDNAFAPSANGLVRCIALQGDGGILVAGDFTMLAGQSCSYLGRLKSDGTLDPTFSPAPNASVTLLVPQADGKIDVVGGFSQLAGQARFFFGQLNRDGTLNDAVDPDLNGGPWSMILQSDGAILLGGPFTRAAGQARTAIARLINPDPATQSLEQGPSGVTWFRGGSSPEVWRTRFEASTNGGTWTSLGDGTRIPGGWVCSATNLPPAARIRARGFNTAGGFSGSSSWFVESVLSEPRFAILTDDGDFGWRSDRFGFNIIGPTGQSAVIEASTNLANWTALATNALGAGPLYFEDTVTQHPCQKFYRLRRQ
jgi:uncharacterized delta-60 repeat protein